MSIKSYLEHRQLMRLIAVLLTILMLYSCFSICMIDAKAAALEIGISLIALILSGFGVVASTTGAIDGMNQGLESLMGEFSESQGQDPGWFRGLFNTDNITSKGYNRLGIGGVLVAGIKLFMEWLRVEKGLSNTDPIVVNGSHYLNIDGFRLPFATLQSYHRLTYYNALVSVELDMIPESLFPVRTDYSTQVLYNTSLFNIKVENYGYSGSELKVKVGGNTYTSYYINSPPNLIDDSYTNCKYILILYNGKLITGLITDNGYFYDNRNETRVNVGNVITHINTITNDGIGIPINIGNVVSESGWQIDDDNLDTDYLDNEDDSTKDVIFIPVYPAEMPLDDLDLGTIGGMEEAAGRTYDYSQSETGTAVGEGEITTDSNLQPGDNEVPDIEIPSGGFFSTIWHYVVEALQVSKDGISFILNVVNTVIPPSIITLCWASCVLLIVFGILNKFLK